MSDVRIYVSKGKRYAYLSGVAVKSKVGTPAFLQEIAALRTRHQSSPAITLGDLIDAYGGSLAFEALAAEVALGQRKSLRWLARLSFISMAMDEIAIKRTVRVRAHNDRGRAFAKRILMTLQAALQWGRDTGFLSSSARKHGDP